MKSEKMKEKTKIAVLCGIFLAVILVLGGVVYAWKKTFAKEDFGAEGVLVRRGKKNFKKVTVG